MILKPLEDRMEHIQKFEVPRGEFPGLQSVLHVDYTRVEKMVVPESGGKPQRTHVEEVKLAGIFNGNRCNGGFSLEHEVDIGTGVVSETRDDAYSQQKPIPTPVLDYLRVNLPGDVAKVLPPKVE